MSTALFDLANDVLANVVDVFALEGIELPDVRYVFGGNAAGVAYECPLVAVGVERIFPGQPGREQGQVRFGSCHEPLAVALHAVVIRCVPIGAGPPTAAEWSDNAGLILGDVDCLSRHAAELSPPMPSGATDRDVLFGGVQTLPPQGGVGGCLLTLILGANP